MEIPKRRLRKLAAGRQFWEFVLRKGVLDSMGKSNLPFTLSREMMKADASRGESAPKGKIYDHRSATYLTAGKGLSVSGIEC